MRRDGKYGRNGYYNMVYVITAICLIGLLAGLFYSLYMAIWGVHEEY
tara:strand:- start:189 stop:329 length:141 start_codon:yes stop_codon:yes gene_type:complete